MIISLPSRAKGRRPRQSPQAHLLPRSQGRGVRQLLRPASSLPMCFQDDLQPLQISWGAGDREVKEMQEATLGRTANRSVLGIVNEVAFALTFRRDNESLTGLALWLA